MSNPRPEKSARVVQFRPRPALDAAVSAAIEARRAIGRCKAEFAALLATHGITPAEIDPEMALAAHEVAHAVVAEKLGVQVVEVRLGRQRVDIGDLMVAAIVDTLLEDIELDVVTVPDNLDARLRDYLARHPAASWDDAIAEIAGGAREA